MANQSASFCRPVQWKVEPRRINIALLTYNALDFTKMCIDSIVSNTREPFNIFVLDNASKDQTPRWLAERKEPNLFVEYSDVNLGVPGGRNRLLEALDPYIPEDGFIIFLDNDIELRCGWEKKFLSFFAEHPEVGIAGAWGHLLSAYETKRELFPPTLESAPVDSASGGFACWIRIATARANGKYDENLGLFWHEDDDYSIRAIANGFDVYALPHLVRDEYIIHHEHSSGVANDGLEQGGSIKNQTYLINKWRAAGWLDQYGRVRRDKIVSIEPDEVNLVDGVVGRNFSRDLGGYRRVYNQAQIEVMPKLPVRFFRLELELKCRNLEFYKKAPFEAVIRFGKQKQVVRFSQDDQTRPVTLIVDTERDGRLILIESSSMCIPCLANYDTTQRAEALHLTNIAFASLTESEYHDAVLDNKTIPPKYRYHVRASFAEYSEWADYLRRLFTGFDDFVRDASFEMNDPEVRYLRRIRDDDIQRPLLIDLLSRERSEGSILITADPQLLLKDPTAFRERWEKERSHFSGSVLFFQASEYQITQQWVSLLNEQDELWVVDEDERLALLSAGVRQDKIQIIPFGVNSLLFAPELKQQVKEGQTLFVAAADYFDDLQLQLIFKGFNLAFGANPSVKLVILMHTPFLDLSIPEQFTTEMSKKVDQVLKETGLRQEELPSISFVDCEKEATLVPLCYQTASVFLRLNRDQGCMYELLKALALGVPVIIPNFGGSAKFCGDDAAYLIDIDGKDDGKLFWNGITGVRPSLAHLVSVLRQAHEDTSLRNQKGMRAIEKTRQLGIQNSVRLMLDRLTRLWFQVGRQDFNSQTSIEDVAAPMNVKVVGDTLRLAVDARTLAFGGSASRGIGHYTVNHLKAVMSKYPELPITFYLEDGMPSDSVKALMQFPQARLKFYDKDGPIVDDVFHIPDPMGVQIGYDSPFQYARGHKATVLFHDLIPMLFPELHYNLWPETNKVAYQTRLSQLRYSKAFVMTNSECTRQDVLKYAQISPERTCAIMAGLNQSTVPRQFTDAESFPMLEKFGIKRPYFMVVGGCDSHKNFATSVNAVMEANNCFEKYPEKYKSQGELQLVVVGSLKDDPIKVAYKEAFRQREVNNVVFTDFVEREELECLYSNAAALLFPSEYEGFGFPVLEAMARGCAVITSNRGSIPEVGGDAVLYIEPRDYVAMAMAILRILTEEGLKESLIAQGLAQAKKFTWDNVAQKSYEIWKKVAQQ